MNNFFAGLKRKIFFFIPLTLMLLSGLVWILLKGKAATFIALNAYHRRWLDVFFINYTFIGDGFFALIVIAVCIFVFKQKKMGIALLAAFLSSGIIAQVIKNLAHSPRPKLFFQPGQYSFFIDGVTLSNWSSLPSGHSTSVFAVATVFVFFLKDKRLQLPIFFAAILTGYSRIYLAQHFLQDVLLGAFIGSVCGLICAWYVNNSRNNIFFIKKTDKGNGGAATKADNIQTTEM